MDVHKDSVTVCLLIIEDDGEFRTKKRQFGACAENRIGVITENSVRVWTSNLVARWSRISSRNWLPR
jgi:hypothetical protein